MEGGVCQLVEVIYDGKPFDDSGHLESLYGAFAKEDPDYVDMEYPGNGGDQLGRIKSMKRSFRWKPVPKIYFKRFQKCAELSTALKERANKYLYSTEEDMSLPLKQALRGYNLALAFAPNNSMELALAYEKRADLLIRLEFPEEAQKDIHSATSNTSYPMKSAQKLIELQNRCTAMAHAKNRYKILVSSGFGGGISTEMIDDTREARRLTENQFYKLKNRNPCVSNVADCTEIDYQPHCGRKVIVTRDVQPGEVLMIDEPFGLILEKMLKWDNEHCTNCSKPVSAGIPCDSCTFGWFCSKSCLEQGNRGIHKFEHNYLSYLRNSPIMSLKGLLACRILFRVGPEELYRIFSTKDPLYFPNPLEEDPKYRGYDGNGLYSSNSYLPIYHLISHPDVNILKSKSNAFKSLLMVNLIQESSDFFMRTKYKEDFEDFKDFIASLLLRHMESIEYNAITLSKMSEEGGQTVRYGAGVYPVLCLINHSCDPNCVPVRSLKFLKTSVIAMKTLKAGDEVTFSYAPHFSQMELEDRQKFLYDRYNFYCKCEACLPGWGPMSQTVYVPESQCNACGRYLLAGQCPKCVRKDIEIKQGILMFQSQVIEVKGLVERGKLVEAMGVVKACLQFCGDSQFQPNFALGLEYQEIFKMVLVSLVSL